MGRGDEKVNLGEKNCNITKAVLSMNREITLPKKKKKGNPIQVKKKREVHVFE